MVTKRRQGVPSITNVDHDYARSTPELSSRLAEAFARHRWAAAQSLTRSMMNWPKFKDQIEEDIDEFTRRETVALVDYLALHFRTGDETYKHLYVGERLKQCYDPRLSTDDALQFKKLAAANDLAALQSVLTCDLSEVELELLRKRLTEIGGILSGQANRSVEILMVGDCLFLDILAFATGPCLEDGVTINPTFVTTKNPVEQRKMLHELSNKKFDLVFYSPFTYEFNAAVGRYMYLRHSFDSRQKIHSTVKQLTDEIKPTLDILATLFECNIIVHNTANVRRHDGTIKERTRNLITHRARSLASYEASKWIAEQVNERNSGSFHHLFVFDELSLKAKHGELALGLMYYDSHLQHPAAMGKLIAECYRDIIFAHALLVGRKLIVCDLDNTLWNGLIGEGRGVEHYSSKQATLKRLKARGVVLAINSKNDPKNIRWDGAGAVLSSEDFVCAQVNWDSKVGNTRRIAQALNLKPKDFVFVDDRADERAFIKDAMPEIQVLDATDDRTWRLFDLWCQYLSSSSATDRTHFYKEREQRASFFETQATSTADQTEAFKKLGMKVHIREAAADDLKRVVELINRTNQFNLCGSRTSAREVSRWMDTGERRIFLADAADKFGSMGTVGILVAHPREDKLEIPIFVLSCRVFGYGIEQALLNHLKRVARSARADGTPLPLVGLYQKTLHNEPCRTVYPANGFSWHETAWLYEDHDGVLDDPEWLAITVTTQS